MHRERILDLFARSQLVLCVVGFIAPHTVITHHQLAVHAFQRHGLERAASLVNIDGDQTARADQTDIGFAQIDNLRACDLGRIIGAVNGHSDALRSAISSLDGDAVVVFFVRFKLILRGFHGVGPLARTGDGESAVTVVAEHPRLRHDAVRTVRIGDLQGSSHSLDGISLGQGSGCTALELCCVIGAHHVHGQDLGCAVRRPHGQGVRVNFTGLEFIVGSVHGVGPSPRLIDRELAIALAASNIGLCHKFCFTVQITDGQDAAEGLCHVIFCERRGRDATNHSSVVCASNRDVDNRHGAVS